MMKINSKIALYFTFIGICCVFLNYYLWSIYKDTTLLTIVVLFCAIIISLSVLFIYILKKHMEHILNQLSQVIASIIDMNEEEVFSISDDDMLSKLQSQVLKLTNILKSQNRKIKMEGDDIKSLISDIAHQLKTPLSNLRLYYDLLQDTSISKEEYAEFSDYIQNQIIKLSFLFESMIKMSRLEGGVIKLVPNKTSLNEICLTAIKQVYQKANMKNIVIEFDPDKDIILNIDKNWTIEAIFNIIDNAVKYTDVGGIVTINTVKYEMFARLDISDNGQGIQEDEINSIFKRFYRGISSQNEEGVGLGLYLARKIISKQNGYIKVTSKIGQGSVFSLFLPLN